MQRHDCRSVVRPPPRRSWRRLPVAILLLAVAPAASATAQDANFMLPIPEIEQRLRVASFEIQDWQGSRAPGDRTQRVLLFYPDSTLLLAKWASAPPGGGVFNNEPRYEVAAYEIQKLFLDPDEYAVPPTVLRAFPHAYVNEQSPGVRPTFRQAESVLVVLQYWLSLVGPDNVWNERRAQADSVYARHVGNLNALTYLINHLDSNIGNFLISDSETNPRVFAVDNGLSFRSRTGNRGSDWREMRVRRLPAHTVARLRAITPQDLERSLGVLGEFEVRDGQLVPVPPGENMDPRRGVRTSADRVQLGLTRVEITDVAGRLRNLLSQVDRGRITEF